MAKVRFGEPITLFNGKNLERLEVDSARRGQRLERQGRPVGEHRGSRAGQAAQGVRQSADGAGIRGLPHCARSERAPGGQQRRLPPRDLRGASVRQLRQAPGLPQHGRDLQPHHAQRGRGEARRTVADDGHDAGGSARDGDPQREEDHRQQAAAGLHGRGCWSDQLRPGPVYLQGDHTAQPIGTSSCGPW